VPLFGGVLDRRCACRKWRVRAVQAACSYSCGMPPSRSRRRTFSWASWFGAGDRFGQQLEGPGVGDARMRPMLVIEDLCAACGADAAGFRPACAPAARGGGSAPSADRAHAGYRSPLRTIAMQAKGGSWQPREAARGACRGSPGFRSRHTTPRTGGGRVADAFENRNVLTITYMQLHRALDESDKRAENRRESYTGSSPAPATTCENAH
jgi:hypothetical protein